MITSKGMLIQAPVNVWSHCLNKYCSCNTGYNMFADTTVWESINTQHQHNLGFFLVMHGCALRYEDEGHIHGSKYCGHY